MANPFDQFDQGPPAAVAAAPQANPFDKFDAPAPAPAPAPAAAAPPDPHADDKAAWASATPLERVKLLASHFGPEAAKQAKDLGETAASVGLQGGLATVGQAAGALVPGAEPVTIPLGGAAGGMLGNYLTQKMKISEGKQDAVKPGELAGATIASAIPGAGLEETGASSIAKEAAKQGVGGLAAKTAETEADQGRLPTGSEALLAATLPAAGGALAQKIQTANPEIENALAEAEASTAAKRATLAAGQKEGYSVIPSSVNPSTLNKSLESLAGKAAVGQGAAKGNQDITDALAKRSIGLSPDDELTSAAAQSIRKDAYTAGYQPVAGAGNIPTDKTYLSDLDAIVAGNKGAARSFPGAVSNEVESAIAPMRVDKFDAGDALKMTQVLRNDANVAYSSGNNQLGGALKDASSAIEDQIERHLQSTGKQGADMLQDFRDARTLMAKSHDVEDSIREGSNSVIASKLGAKAQAGKPLTGDLKTIGDMANNFPSAMREGSKVPSPGVSALNPLATTLLTGAGLAEGGGHGALAGAAAGLGYSAVRAATRKIILSPSYQRLMAKIPLDVNATPDAGALAVRQISQAAGQEADEK